MTVSRPPPGKGSKCTHLEHVFDRDFPSNFRKFWGFGGVLGPVNKKRGVSISLRAVHILVSVVIVRNAMDPGFGRLLTPWSVDFLCLFLNKISSKWGQKWGGLSRGKKGV